MSRARLTLAQAAWSEPGVDTAPAARELAAELSLMASWLELETVAVARRGDLAAELATAVRLSQP